MIEAETVDSLQNQTLEANALVEQLFAKGDFDFLRSAISQEEGRFLQGLAGRPHVRNAIEVGCANGVSSICICSGISSKIKPSHTAIDPFQYTDFGGRGVQNVRRAGFDFFELVEKPSELALPDLMSRGKSYEFAFIDGLHTADQTLLDFYYLDRMIPVGGIIVIDDVNGRSVNKVAHYVSTYPNYRVIGTSGLRGRKRWFVNLVKQAVAVFLWPGRKIFKESAMREFFDISLLQPQHLWTIDFCTMIAFEKVYEFKRDTNWYQGL